MAAARSKQSSPERPQAPPLQLCIFDDRRGQVPHRPTSWSPTLQARSRLRVQGSACITQSARQQGHWYALQQVEGEEADKVLAFFPRDVKPNNQSAVVGLVQAMLAFSSIFSQVCS
jgi:hypothetical protein